MNNTMERLITIGVPARNEERTIEKTVRSLLDQELPKGVRHEIIVCSNSDDRTSEIVQSIAERNPAVKLIETNTLGKGNAMNTIVRNASGRSSVLFFCDADTLPEKRAVSKLLQSLDGQPEIQAVSSFPRYAKMNGENWVEKMAIAVSKTWVPQWFAGAFFAVRREAYREIPEHIVNDDFWLARQVGEKNTRIIDDAEVLTSVPSSLRDFYNQRLRWFVGHYQVEQTDGVIKRPALFTKERLGKLKSLSTLEKLLLVPAYLIRTYAKFAAKNALKERKFQGGWEPPKRT